MLKKYWPSIATVAGSVVLFLSPSVTAFAGTHKGYAVPLLAIWGVFLHWAESPRTTS
jgi:hypothetical protein